MREHLRFSVVYWHTMRGTGGDPFGPGTAVRPWDDGSDSLDNALRRVEVAFEIFEKLQAPFYAFHDRDVAPEGSYAGGVPPEFRSQSPSPSPSTRRRRVSSCCGVPPTCSAIRASCTEPPPAAMWTSLPLRRRRSRSAWKSPKMLGGENYVFWGGREGYQNLYNTDMKRELDHLARFFHMAVDYAKEIGFTGPFLIEPKPKEPTKHQYDSDAAACLNFLRAYDLLPHFKLNLETNHATLAGHTMMHELDYAGHQGALGSIDANTGDLLLGWDTDQFPTDYYLTTQCMLAILKHGGLTDWWREL